LRTAVSICSQPAASGAQYRALTLSRARERGALAGQRRGYQRQLPSPMVLATSTGTASRPMPA